MQRPFLTAHWQYLVMLNYSIDPRVLLPFVPDGTELDQWEGKTFVSLVAFKFCNTKVKGVPIPFHRNFEEVNLRFYVKRKTSSELRRGVVFVKEIVPRLAIALVAKYLYNENYISLPMGHSLNLESQPASVQYRWSQRGIAQHITADFQGAPGDLSDGSQEEFITEHYWGYTKQRDGGTIEYQVTHPRWKVWSARSFDAQVDVSRLYGNVFEPFLTTAPVSAFVAEGSPVAVYAGVRL